MEKCEHEKVIAELTDKNTKLEAEVKEQKTKATELTETHKKLDAELKELKAKAAALRRRTSAPSSLPTRWLLSKRN